MSLTMVGSWAVTTVVVAWAGPFGTFTTQPLLWRLSYWGALIAIAIVIAISLRTIWRSVLKDRPDWQEDIAVSVSLGVVFGPMVVVLNRQLGGIDAYDAMGPFFAIICVFAIAACIIVIRRSIEAQYAPAPPMQVDPQMPRDRLLARIPAAETARLVRIRSDNHHIRVTTHDGGEHRLLMRLRDAVQEIDVEPGMCVHRSHWVATSSIVGVVQDGTRELVQTRCGAQVPVGPKYRQNLVNAGVISD